MSRTGNQLLTGFSRYLGDDVFPQGLQASGNGSTTTIVDTDLSGYSNDYFNGWYVRITEAGDDQYKVRRITDFVASTGTLTFAPAVTNSTTSSTTYELHKVDPNAKFSALDEARFVVYPALGELVYDDTTTADGESNVFDIPSAIRRGPTTVYEEYPISTRVDWNFAQDPDGDSTSNWTASNLTASTVDRDSSDLLVPKYAESATKLVVAGSTNGTYKQTVANMVNGITAALAADRRMTWAAWAYCTESSRLTLTLEDDTGESSSAAHQGLGWELLTVEKTIDGDNSTTLTIGFDVSSAANPVTAYWNHGWFYFGDKERVSDQYLLVQPHLVRRDDTTQQVELTYRPDRGHQLRFVGRDILSALGVTAATQATNTMAVDEYTSELLFAQAARILFRRLSMNLANFPEVAQRIALNEQELNDLKRKWGQSRTGPQITTMWA